MQTELSRWMRKQLYPGFLVETNRLTVRISAIFYLSFPSSKDESRFSMHRRTLFYPVQHCKHRCSTMRLNGITVEKFPPSSHKLVQKQRWNRASSESPGLNVHLVASVENRRTHKEQRPLSRPPDLCQLQQANLDITEPTRILACS